VAIEEGIGSNDERTDLLLSEALKHAIELGLTTGLQHHDGPLKSMCGFVHLSFELFSYGGCGIDEHTDPGDVGNHFTDQLDPLRQQLES